MQRFIHCMFETILGAQNMNETEISFVNNNDVESKIHKKIGLCQNANIQNNIYYKISKQTEFFNRNTPKLPLNKSHIFLDAEIGELFNGTQNS